MERIDRWVASVDVVFSAPDHLCHLPIGDGARAAGSVFSGGSLNAVLYETEAPLADRVLVHPRRWATSLLCEPSAQQDHPASIR